MNPRIVPLPTFLLFWCAAFTLGRTVFIRRELKDDPLILVCPEEARAAMRPDHTESWAHALVGGFADYLARYPQGGEGA